MAGEDVGAVLVADAEGIAEALGDEQEGAIRPSVPAGRW